MPCSKESALDLLLAANRHGRLAHAHLFTGSTGSGKTWLAHALAGAVLDCEPRGVLAHPDAHFVQPESKSRRIVIDQIRDLEQVIHRKPLLSRNKVAMIFDADRLQPQAANAFLKTLEEPPSGCILILTSSLPEAILETVISRCVETSLLGGDTGPGPEGMAILQAIGESLLSRGENGPSVAAAFRLTRAVQQILVSARSRISKEYEAVFKEESARYKNAAGGSDWLDDREEQLKAMTESAALRERERVVGAILYALGGALRAAHGGDCPHEVCKKLAERFSTADLLAMIDSWETMQRRLAMTVNEGLALEAGMLEISMGGKL
jgi:DNA polymerase-3 subunit delta'